MSSQDIEDWWVQRSMAAGRDNNSASGNGFLAVFQSARWMMPVIVVLVMALVANAVIMGLNLSRQASIETALRSDTVSQDLRRYETEQTRVQAQLNAELQKLILQRGCKP